LRRPFVTAVTLAACHATGDSGCAPPLEIQSSSFRDRMPSRAPADHETHLRFGA
jgi:hypothetical protein